MPEMFPDIPVNMRVISVVVCRGGYQAIVEKEVERTAHPHYETHVLVARGKTICEAIEKAKTGQRKISGELEYSQGYENHEKKRKSQ